MPLQILSSKKTVSVLELSKNPCAYFLDEPVAVLSNDKTMGYMLSANLYEQVVKLLESQANACQFRPSSARLAFIAEYGATLLSHTEKAHLGDFEE